MATLTEARVLKRAHEEHFLGLPGVTAVDVGYKEVGGELTEQLAIRVHVATKKKRVPEGQRVPRDIDGVVTDVLERDYKIRTAVATKEAPVTVDTTRYRTLRGGISMGPLRVIDGGTFGGTLGVIVIDLRTNKRAALTNFHVACVDSTWQSGDPMVQPERLDPSTMPPPGDEFGAILRAELSRTVDCALISVYPSKHTNSTIEDIGEVRGTKPAALLMSVRKRGRTTRLTYGTVDGLSASVSLDYGDGLGRRLLRNQVSVRADTARNLAFSGEGDSGSVIVDDSGYVVGLLFAGAQNSAGECPGAMCNPIAPVLRALNISIGAPA